MMVEAHVVLPWYRDLFPFDEIFAAEDRLALVDFDVKSFIAGSDGTVLGATRGSVMVTASIRNCRAMGGGLPALCTFLGGSLPSGLGEPAHRVPTARSGRIVGPPAGLATPLWS